MHRKLIQLSPSTSVVSLPSKWVKMNKLEKGSELDVDEKENKIVISTQSQKSEKEISIDITNLKDRLFWAYLDAAYIAGYDVINLHSEDQKQLNLMSKVAKSFPGMIVVEQRKNSATLKDLAGENKEDIDKILNRIFHMNTVLIEDALEAVKNSDWETLVIMKKRDHIINSYVSYCMRQINRFGYTPYSKGGVMHTFLKLIEIISDKITALFEEIGEKHIKVEPKIISKLLEIYQLMRTAHMKYSQDKMIEFHKAREALPKPFKQANKKIVGRLMELMHLFYDLEEVETQLHV